MADAIELYVDQAETPIGQLVLVADARGRLRATDWTDPMGSAPRLLQQLTSRYQAKVALITARNPGGATDALNAYFAGDLGAIDTLSVEARGTPFQREVWSALRDIPCGTTISYAELARRIGRPSAVRAVGLANGANPISIVVPCHRVIGADGSLTGYGGGIERKRWLLAHEGSLPALFP